MLVFLQAHRAPIGHQALQAPCLQRYHGRLAVVRAASTTAAASLVDSEFSPSQNLSPLDAGADCSDSAPNAVNLVHSDEQHQWQHKGHQQHETAAETLHLLQLLHSLCDSSSDSGQLASPAQLEHWSQQMQPYLCSMSLPEVAYVAACLRHQHFQWQQWQQHHQQQQVLPGVDMVGLGLEQYITTPEFVQEVCAAAMRGVDEAFQMQQEQWHQGQQPQQLQADSTNSTAPHAIQLDMHEVLQQLLEVVMWASNEVVQQRQCLQRQWQQQQQAVVPEPASGPAAAAVQVYRIQLQQQAQAAQEVLQLLQHPLLPQQLLREANCWQLQHLLQCYGQVGQTPQFDWMGQWLAAARHSMADLILPFQQHYWHHQQHLQHSLMWQQHRAAAAAAAYTQLVGLLSGLAAARVRPPVAWIAAWQQAATAALAAQPCFDDGSSSSSSSSTGASSFFEMLQQLLQSVSFLKLRLSAEFWAAHEGMVQQQLLSFSPEQLLRLVQLHQQLGLRPSKACTKYIAAQLERQIHTCWQQQQQLQQEQQQQQCLGDSGSSSSSGSVLHVSLCVCGLSVWGVRLPLGCVSALLLCLQAAKHQLPLPVLLQVLSTLGSRLALVHSHGNASSSSTTSMSTSSSTSTLSQDSSSSSSSSSLSSSDVDEPCWQPSAPAVLPSHVAAAAAVEDLLDFAAGQLAAMYTACTNPLQGRSVMTTSKSSDDAAAATGAGAAGANDNKRDGFEAKGTAAPASGHDKNTSSNSSSRQPELRPLLQLLQVAAHLQRNSSSHNSSRMTGQPLCTTVSVASLAAGAATTGQTQSPSTVTYLDRLVYRLHPLAEAVAPTCTLQQLILLMTGWTDLGYSSAWRFGGFRRAFRRLGQPGQLQTLSNAELTSAVVAVGKLPQTKQVVASLAAEVQQRLLLQQQPQQEGHQQDGARQLDGAATAAAVALEPFTPVQLVDIITAVPALSLAWPSAVTLNIMLQVQVLVEDRLNPSQQWRLWNGLQQLQRRWKPAVVAAAAVASASTDSSNSRHGGGGGGGGVAAVFTAAAAATAGRVATRGSGDDEADHVPLAAALAPDDDTRPSAAAAATLSPVGQLMAPPQRVAKVNINSSRGNSSNLHQQQQLMRLLDDLQHQVAAALARVHSDPEALPTNAAPPKTPRPAAHSSSLHAQAAAAARGGSETAFMPPPVAYEEMPGVSDAHSTGRQQQQQQQQEEGHQSLQQVLAAFAKAQKSLLNPRCSGAALTHVLEGLVLLLVVPRFRNAALKVSSMRQGVLRALEAAAWPELMAHTLDGQQLLLALAAAHSLGAPADGPYMQLLSSETARVLGQLPAKQLAAVLGRVAALNLPGFNKAWNLILLRVWVGRLAQEARRNPEDAMAVLVPLVQLGFRPAAGAAALVLQPLLQAASSGISSSSSRSAARVCAKNTLKLTRVLVEMGLYPDADHAQRLLEAHVAAMQHLNTAQLLQLGRDVMMLGLLVTPAAGAGAAGAGAAAAGAAAASCVELSAGGDEWVRWWLHQLVVVDTNQMDVAEMVECQMLLCELDLVPWFKSPLSPVIHNTLQYVQSKLAAAAADWQQPLAAAVQANYQATQALRRLVAARARKQAHTNRSAGTSPNSSPSSSYASVDLPPNATASSGVRAAFAAALLGEAAGPASPDAAGVDAVLGVGTLDAASSSNSSSAGGSGRRFMSKAAAAAANGVSTPGGAAAAGFTYHSDVLGHQLQQLNKQRQLLLWAATKHRVVGPMTEAWVESCCFIFLLGIHGLTPAVATGLLMAVAEARRNSSSMSGQPSSLTEDVTAAAAAADPMSVMREKALTNLTASLVGRVLVLLPHLRGGVLVQTAAELATAGVVTVAAAHHQQQQQQPLFQLRLVQQQALLRAVLRQLPALRPAQLPLLVTSMSDIGLKPPPAWLAAALRCLAGKAEAAARAGAPAQQLLLLAAAKQLLSCSGVLMVEADAAAAAALDGRGANGSDQFAGPSNAIAGTIAAAGRRPAVASAVVPGASAVRTLAAAAAHVVLGLFRRGNPTGQHQQGGQFRPVSAPQTRPAAATQQVVPTGDASAAVLLSSLAAQLQLVQGAEGLAAGTGAAAVNKQAIPPAQKPADINAQVPAQQQQQLLAAAAVMAALQGGTTRGSPLSAARTVRPAGAQADATSVRLHSPEGLNRQAQQQQQHPERWQQLGVAAGFKVIPAGSARRQQQQQRQMLGQLLRLELQRVSEQLVQTVWGGSSSAEQQHLGMATPASVVSPSAVAVASGPGAAFCTQLLSAAAVAGNAGDCGSYEQQQQLDEREENEAEETEEYGQQHQQQWLRPQQLVTQGLHVQFDGLLRKAFMAAAAAANKRQQEQRQQEQRQLWRLNPPAVFTADSVDSIRAPASLAASLMGPSSSGGSSSDSGIRTATLSSTNSSTESVVILPVMSRALDAQFARLLRDVLHSSLVTTARTGGSEPDPQA